MNAEIHFKNVMGGSGGYMYSIDGGANYQADTFFVGLGVGAYQLMVTDITMCATMAVDTMIYQPEAIVTEFTVTEDVCFGNLGEIEFTSVTGGTGSLMYSIDGGANFITETTFTDLDGGDYQLLVQDENLCNSDISDISINILDDFIIESVVFDSISSEANATIEVSVSGGLPPYTYTLSGDSNPQETGEFSIPDAGTYTVEINDYFNCGPLTTDPIEIVSVVGISNHRYIEALVYPNPTRGEVTIEMPSKSTSSTFEVVSMTGQVMNRTTLYSSGGQIKGNLQLHDLAKGMYLLRVDGKVVQSAIVLQ